MTFIQILAVAALTAAMTSSADLLVFKSGARLTGKVDRIEGGEIKFTSDDVGAVSVKQDKVASITTEANNTILYNDKTTEEAVVREVREETGITLEIDRILFFQEQFFDEETTGEHIHELGVYYLMRDSEALDRVECRSVTGRGAAEELVWVRPEELRGIPFVPESVGERLLGLPETMEHLIEINSR